MLEMHEKFDKRNFEKKIYEHVIEPTYYCDT